MQDGAHMRQYASRLGTQGDEIDTMTDVIELLEAAVADEAAGAHVRTHIYRLNPPMPLNPLAWRSHATHTHGPFEQQVKRRAVCCQMNSRRTWVERQPL